MAKAFTFGKYYPFHKGHEALIQFALEKFNEVYVIVCVADSEKIPGSIRSNWILDSFPKQTNLTVQVFNYSEDKLPNTSVPSESVSEIWAKEFEKILPKIDCVVTSEKYGEYLARYMNIEHTAFNPNRSLVPISSSKIRKSTGDSWEFLTPSTQKSLLTKVVILGTESTGKTTLTKHLSEHFNCDIVSEVGREIVSNSNSCTINKLKEIALTHANSIDLMVASSKTNLLLIDTDVHITMSYARYLLNTELKPDQHIIQSNQADLYIYLDNDCDFMQDGTRLDKNKRNELHDSHLKVLNEHAIDYKIVSGSWGERFSKSVQIIQGFLDSFY